MQEIELKTVSALSEQWTQRRVYQSTRNDFHLTVHVQVVLLE